MKLNPFKYVVLPLIAICLLTALSTQSRGQASQVLNCTERDSVSDVKRFPRQAKVTRTRSGSVVYLEWEAFIGNDPGNYKMTLSSRDDFRFIVFETSRMPGSKPREIGRGDAYTTGTGYNTTYYFAHTFTSRGIYSEGSDILVRVEPYVKETSVSLVWYTTGCRKSPPPPAPSPSKTCVWIGQVFGIGCECQCNGRRASDPKACGPKPSTCP